MLFVHVLAADGRRVAQRDLPLRSYDYPTSRWRPGELVIDSADLPLPELPAGAYRVVAGLYSPRTGQRLAAAAQGDCPENAVPLAEVHIE